MEDEKPPILDYQRPGKDPGELQPNMGCGEGCAMVFAGAIFGLMASYGIASSVNQRHTLPWMAAPAALAIVACVFRNSRPFGIGMLLVVGILSCCVGVCGGTMG